jgi:hypothetical protein
MLTPARPQATVVRVQPRPALMPAQPQSQPKPIIVRPQPVPVQPAPLVVQPDPMLVSPELPAALLSSNTPVKWPGDTDIVFVEGTNRVILTLQRPLIRSVVQEGFETLRAHLLFDHAFPDGSMISSLIKESLLQGAMSKMPRAAVIYQRLVCDEDYARRLWPLVSFELWNTT